MSNQNINTVTLNAGDLSNMTNDEMRDLCTKLNLHTSGNREVLTDRLSSLIYSAANIEAEDTIEEVEVVAPTTKTEARYEDWDLKALLLKGELKRPHVEGSRAALLRDLCAEYGQKVSGNKAALVERVMVLAENKAAWDKRSEGFAPITEEEAMQAALDMTRDEALDMLAVVTAYVRLIP